MRILRCLGLAVAFTFTLATVAIGAADEQEVRQGTYRIRPGDILDVIVWRTAELTMALTVRPDGWISFPLIGEVHVDGMTPIQLQKMLEKSLAAVVSSPMITVVVTKVAGFKVSILGKVRQPGRYDVEASTTVLDVLALASGPNDYADASGMIYVLRRSESGENLYERIPVKYSTHIIPGKDNANVPVKPGDIIMVP